MMQRLLSRPNGRDPPANVPNLTFAVAGDPHFQNTGFIFGMLRRTSGLDYVGSGEQRNRRRPIAWARIVESIIKHVSGRLLERYALSMDAIEIRTPTAFSSRCSLAGAAGDQ
jgi:hypothetical protein